MQELRRLSLLIGEEQLKKMSQKKVLILGLGGVGGYAAEALARSGIGTLILVDDDRIDITNMNRQIIALYSSVGMSKVEAFRKRILDIQKNCNVIPIPVWIQPNNIEIMFPEKVDYVIDACDTISVKFALIQYCLARNIPLITCLGTGKRMDPTQLMITELSKTQNDPIARVLRKKVKEMGIKQKIKVVYTKELPKKIPSKEIASGIFVPSCAGILAANYVFGQLLQEN